MGLVGAEIVGITDRMISSIRGEGVGGRMAFVIMHLSNEWHVLGLVSKIPGVRQTGLANPELRLLGQMRVIQAWIQ